MLNDGSLIYSVNEVKAMSARRRIGYTVVANRRRYIGRNFGSNRRNRAGRFKPADLALSEGDHAKFSRISMSNGTKRLLRGPPRDSTVKRWTPLPSAFLASLAFPADFGDFVSRFFSILFLDGSRNILVDLLIFRRRESVIKTIQQ